MIPPDNATGNFVKVVQRIPVKITWTTPPRAAMRPGLSAEVTVHVGSRSDTGLTADSPQANPR